MYVKLEQARRQAGVHGVGKRRKAGIMQIHLVWWHHSSFSYFIAVTPN